MNYLYSSQYDPKGAYSRLWGQAIGVPGVPYVPTAGIFDVFAEEKQLFEDAGRLQSFYPEIAREIQLRVAEVCDQMEYEGSMMFDEYPDRIMILRLVDKVKGQMKEFLAEGDTEKLLEGEAAAELEHAAGGEELSQNPLSGQAGRRQPPPPPKGNDWLGDLVQVVLLDEMHRRRCRHRRCRLHRIW